MTKLIHLFLGLHEINKSPYFFSRSNAHSRLCEHDLMWNASLHHMSAVSTHRQTTLIPKCFIDSISRAYYLHLDCMNSTTTMLERCRNSIKCHDPSVAFQLIFPMNALLSFTIHIFCPYSFFLSISISPSLPIYRKFSIFVIQCIAA